MTVAGKAHILQVIGASPFGGATRVILAVVRGLLAEGHRVSVLTSDPRTQEAFSAIGASIVTCRQYVRPIRPVQDLRAVAETVGVCRRERIDVLHTHTSKGGVIGRAAGRWLKTPVVHTVHGYPFHEFSRPADGLFFRMVEGACAPLAAHTVFVNQEDQTHAVRQRWIEGAHCSVIPNGVAVPPLPAPAPEHAGRPRLVTVGRLSPPKGYPVLLEAFSMLRRDYPEATLWFVGDGESRPALEARARQLALGESVRFLGFQPRPLEWLEQCHVAVSSSLWEGMPVAVLEMMAARRPVVATACRGTREVIRRGTDGLLARPGEAASLHQMLVEMLADEARAREMASTARRRVEEAFSEERMVASYLTLFEGIGRGGMDGHAWM